jgi:drug/metabolite transporter (DMT)-like permease
VLKIIVLTATTMLAFAANSLLARLALLTPNADALGFTGVRLATGAIVLAVILAIQASRSGQASFAIGGTWSTAAALFSYAITFSFAYLLLGAAMGALILFGSVQLSMLFWAITKGERLITLEWFGLGVALAAFVYLVFPGLTAPHPTGAALMVVSGISWAVYTLLGRGSRAPLVDTAGNFIRCLPIAVVLMAMALAQSSLDWRTGLLATVSGALASGGGYAVWYTVLPAISRTRAAIVQLTVPPIAALGAVLVLGEPLTLRLLFATLGVLGGVALAVVASSRK